MKLLVKIIFVAHELFSNLNSKELRITNSVKKCGDKRETQEKRMKISKLVRQLQFQFTQFVEVMEVICGSYGIYGI